MQVAIIDSGGANIASLQFAFERIGVAALLTTDTNVIKTADRVLLPGVGAARDAMTRLRDADLIDTIRALRQPVLGICLGMQLLCDASEEENVDCLGVLPGVVTKLEVATDYPVPNMGWCRTKNLAAHPLMRNIGDGSFFYYLHSYALPVSQNTVATAAHTEIFSAVVSHENFVAAQFHPELSSSAGAQLLKNFVQVGS